VLSHVLCGVGSNLLDMGSGGSSGSFRLFGAALDLGTGCVSEAPRFRTACGRSFAGDASEVT
jgi:hypothetical protein